VKWLRWWAMRRAAKTYAQRLPAELNADWGASDTYTVGQVRAAIQRCRLGGRYVAVAYAAFLTEADYLAIAGDLPLVLPYDLAREVYGRMKPSGDSFSDSRDSETKSALGRGWSGIH
jgi:hypothetical protein